MVAGLAACAGDPRPREDRLREAMERRLRQHGVKGASAAVVLPDGSLKLAAAGVPHDDVRMSPDMAFAVGSITKNMVAALALRLAEAGYLKDPYFAPGEGFRYSNTVREGWRLSGHHLP